MGLKPVSVLNRNFCLIYNALLQQSNFLFVLQNSHAVGIYHHNYNISAGSASGLKGLFQSNNNVLLSSFLKLFNFKYFGSKAPISVALWSIFGYIWNAGATNCWIIELYK